MSVVTAQASAAKEAPRSATVELVGSVESMSPIDLPPPSRHLWSVTFLVETVKSGKYSEPKLTFSVHSPARAGLRTGGRYSLEATWNGRGYEVRESDIVLVGGDEDVQRVESSGCESRERSRLGRHAGP